MTTDTPRRRLAGTVVAALLLGGMACGDPVSLEVDPGAPATEPTSIEVTPEEDASSAAATPSQSATGEPTTPGPSPEPTTPEPTAAEDTTPDQPEQAPSVLERGARGEAVLVLQQRLADLGYWVGPTDGDYGDLTEQAVLALQGWEGITRDGRVGPETRAALQDATRPVPDTAGGDRIEIHLPEQVLLAVTDGRVVAAVHTSTGSGGAYTHPAGHQSIADTPTGTWQISWRVDGWRESDLGRLYRPTYFHEDGLAIHGYPDVPAHPASHGCARVSMGAMDMLWARDLVAEGTPVVVS